MDIMDVAGLSMDLSSTRVINDVQVAVLKKSLDTLESNGDGLTKMMEASVTPNLGQNIDVVAGIFDDSLLELRGCAGVEISKEPFCVAVSIHHRLAKKDVITLDDMRNETLMLMHRGWSSNGDKLRDDIIENYPDINISDFDLYNIDVFNRCENNQELLLAFKGWESVHPLIRIKSVEWDYTMPYGLLYSKEPSAKVKKLVKAIEKVK